MTIEKLEKLCRLFVDKDTCDRLFEDYKQGKLSKRELVDELSKKIEEKVKGL